MGFNSIGVNIQKPRGHSALSMHFLHIGQGTHAIEGVIVCVYLVELQYTAVGHGHIFLGALSVVGGNLRLTKNQVCVHGTVHMLPNELKALRRTGVIVKRHAG